MNVLKKGKLIVIEGLDGSGKATQTSILTNKLRLLKKRVSKVSFPDYNQKSSTLVKMYLNSEFGQTPSEVNAYAASSFYAVDRYASFVKFWAQKYFNGQIIIADRYVSSNAIYQLSKLEKNNWDEYLNWLNDYEYNKLSLPKPDLTIYLDMPIEISQKFMSNRYAGRESLKDLHERNVEFLKACRQSALYSASKLGWHIVTCNNGDEPKSINEINDLIFKLVKDVIL